MDHSVTESDLAMQSEPQTLSSAELPASKPASLTKPRVWTVFLTLVLGVGLAFGVQMAVAVSLVCYLLLQGTAVTELKTSILPLMTSPGVFLILVVTGPGSFGVAAALAAWLSPEPFRRRLGLNEFRGGGLYSLAIVGSILPLAIGLGLAQLLAVLVPDLPVDHTAELLFENMTLAWGIPFVVLIGLVPGFCEEIFFRGYVQQRLVPRWGPVVGIGLTSVFFGLSHLAPHVVLFATILGIYFGIVTWKCGSIWPAIGGHIFVNSGLNAWRMVVKFAEPPDWFQTAFMALALIAGALCFFATLWQLFGPRRTPTATELETDLASS